MALTVVILGTDPTGWPYPRGGAGDEPGGKLEPAARRLTFDAPRVVVGRSESCEVRLPERSVSHRHVSLRQRGGDWLIVDEGSTNGTVVERVALAPQSPRVVSDGDLVRVGRVFLQLRLGSADIPTRPAAAKEAAIDLVIDALAAEGEDGRPRVRVVEGPDAGKDLRIESDRRAVLGRARDCDLALEDVDASRRHVEIGRRGDAVVVRDLGSRTGCTLGSGEADAKEVDAADVVWKPGQRLTLAGNVLELEFGALEELADVERAPDQRVAPGDLPWPGAGEIVDAPADADPAALDEQGPDGEVDDDDEDEAGDDRRNRKVTRAPRKAGWSATDFAVVLLALGVLALSAVGYLVLLRR